MTVEMLKLAENGHEFYKIRTDLEYLQSKILKAKLEAAKEASSVFNFDFIDSVLANPSWQNFIAESNNMNSPGKTQWMWRKSISRPQVRYWENRILYKN